MARRTGTVTPFGARFDGEVDAFLILVLSVAVSRDYGGWVLAIGAARYLLLVGGVGGPVAGRTAAAPVLGQGRRRRPGHRPHRRGLRACCPGPVGMIAVGVALVLLAESFGRSVVWLYRTGAGPRTRRALRAGHRAGRGGGRLGRPRRAVPSRPAHPGRVRPHPAGGAGPGRDRAGAAAPAQTGRGGGGGSRARPARRRQAPRRRLHRAARPAVQPGVRLGPRSVRRSGCCATRSGPTATVVVLVLAGLALALLVVVITASTIRLSSGTARHRRRSARGVAVLGVVWAVCAALSLQLVPAGPVASTSTAGLAVAHGRDVEATLRGPAALRGGHPGRRPVRRRSPRPSCSTACAARTSSSSSSRATDRSPSRTPDVAPGVTAVLRSGTDRLARAGLEARSAFLDSPIFGGGSWLAHATLQSGLWIDSQPRYDQLMASDRLTLSGAFGEAGWRTVGVNPANDRPWPEGDVLLPLRPALRPVRPRLPGPGVQLVRDARPVHPGRLPAARAHPGASPR